MKIKVLFRLIRPTGFLLLFSILVSQSSTAFGQGTAFTYQGRLGQNGSPYDGPAEMQFTLFNVPSGGTAMAANTPATASVEVKNGLFTIALDFGAGAFNGDARWLEIAVRTSGASAFTTLTPRQQISAAPYAMAARDVTGSVATQQLTGIIQRANIGTGSILRAMIAPAAFILTFWPNTPFSSDFVKELSFRQRIQFMDKRKDTGTILGAQANFKTDCEL